MEGDQRRRIYTHYAFKAGSTLGCNVAWDVDPLRRTHRALRITKIKRTCPFPQQLQVGDIITHINCNQVSSMDAFRRVFTKETTLRVIHLEEITRLRQLATSIQHEV